MRAAIPAVAGMVMIQVKTMLVSVRHETLLNEEERAMPTNMMAPIAQSVTLIGIPSLLAIRTVNAVPSSIAKPLKYFDRFYMHVERSLDSDLNM
uniref:Uncharacterized protein n=1 Tax=Plectus sambesii TaxID=2011161 RepID=A0A914WCY3_9BILA